MKKFALMLGALALVFAAGCSDDDSSAKKEKEITPKTKAEMLTAQKDATEACDKFAELCPDSFFKVEVDDCKKDVDDWTREDDYCVTEGWAYYDCLKEQLCNGMGKASCLEEHKAMGQCLDARKQKDAEEREASFSAHITDISCTNPYNNFNLVCEYKCSGNGQRCDMSNNNLIICDNGKVASKRSCRNGCHESELKCVGDSDPAEN